MSETVMTDATYTPPHFETRADGTTVLHSWGFGFEVDRASKISRGVVGYLPDDALPMAETIVAMGREIRELQTLLMHERAQRLGLE